MIRVRNAMRSAPRPVDRLQTLSLRFFDRHPHGELMSRLTNDTEAISNTLAQRTQPISSTMSVVGAAYAMSRSTAAWRSPV